MPEEHFKTKTVKPRIPKWVICPACGEKQRFRKKGERWRLVKDMDLDAPTLLRVRIVKAKCLNPHCARKSFTLPVEGVRAYARATERLKEEAVAGVIADNSTCPRIARRLERCFNTAGSKSAVARWKEEAAEGLDPKAIISRLDFSGILCLDEYAPSRSKTYDLIASCAIRNRILWIDNVDRRNSAEVEAYLEGLKGLGLHPWAIIFDLWDPFPGAAKKAFPGVLIQYDYFHIMKTVHWHLRNALAEYRKGLQERGEYELHRLLWKNKWTILKNPEERSEKGKAAIASILHIFGGTVVEEMLVLKERIRDIFLHSATREEALRKRDALVKEAWHLKNIHFRRIIKFFSGFSFHYMVTYLEYPEVPRSGNSENLIRCWRQMEKVRYGFKSRKGRQNHLKLYQIERYLGGNLP